MGGGRAGRHASIRDRPATASADDHAGRNTTRGLRSGDATTARRLVPEQHGGEAHLLRAVRPRALGRVGKEARKAPVPDAGVRREVRGPGLAPTAETGICRVHPRGCKPPARKKRTHRDKAPERIQDSEGQVCRQPRGRLQQSDGSICGNQLPDLAGLQRSRKPRGSEPALRRPQSLPPSGGTPRGGTTLQHVGNL